MHFPRRRGFILLWYVVYELCACEELTMFISISHAVLALFVCLRLAWTVSILIQKPNAPE
jgi:hypothetical protein